MFTIGDECHNTIASSFLGIHGRAAHWIPFLSRGNRFQRVILLRGIFPNLKAYDLRVEMDFTLHVK